MGGLNKSVEQTVRIRYNLVMVCSFVMSVFFKKDAEKIGRPINIENYIAT